LQRKRIDRFDEESNRSPSRSSLSSSKFDPSSSEESDSEDGKASQSISRRSGISKRKNAKSKSKAKEKTNHDFWIREEEIRKGTWKGVAIRAKGYLKRDRVLRRYRALVGNEKAIMPDLEKWKKKAIPASSLKPAFGLEQIQAKKIPKYIYQNNRLLINQSSGNTFLSQIKMERKETQSRRAVEPENGQFSLKGMLWSRENDQQRNEEHRSSLANENSDDEPILWKQVDAINWEELDWDEWATCGYTRPPCMLPLPPSPICQSRTARSSTVVEEIEEAVFGFDQLQMKDGSPVNVPGVAEGDREVEIVPPPSIVETTMRPDIVEIIDSDSEDDFCVTKAVLVPQKPFRPPAGARFYHASPDSDSDIE
jgi:hypothetical protein